MERQLQFPKIRCACGLEISKRQMPAHQASRRHTERLKPERKICTCGFSYKNTEQLKKHERTEKHSVIMSHGSVDAHYRLLSLRNWVRHFQDEINEAEPGTDAWRVANYNLEMVREELTEKFPEYC